jgi:glycosyltransferase involved in cell wall biosynthesis
MKDESFTIIIPTHNSMSGNRDLKRTLDSIMKQTLTNWEIIIVDDLSTDETKATASSYPARFYSVKSSIAKANNFGIEKATGDYIIFLDSDQELPPQFLEECQELIHKVDAQCIGYTQLFVDPTGRSTSSFNRLHNFERFMGAEPSGGIYCYSRKIIGEVRFPENLPVMEDYHFRTKILSKGPRIGYVRSVVLHYRSQSGRWLIIRAWKYGRVVRGLWGNRTQSTMMLKDYFPLTNRNQNIRVHTDVGLLAPVSYLPFMVLKYLAFAFGFMTG